MQGWTGMLDRQLLLTRDALLIGMCLERIWGRGVRQSKLGCLWVY